MPRIPTPLTWKRRNFAVFEDLGMIDRLYAVAVSGLVSGPFAIYNSPHGDVLDALDLRALDDHSFERLDGRTGARRIAELAAREMARLHLPLWQ